MLKNICHRLFVIGQSPYVILFWKSILQINFEHKNGTWGLSDFYSFKTRNLASIGV